MASTPAAGGHNASAAAVNHPKMPGDLDDDDELSPPFFLRQSVLSTWLALGSTRHPLPSLNGWLLRGARNALSLPTPDMSAIDGAAGAWPSLMLEAAGLVPVEAWRRLDAFVRAGPLSQSIVSVPLDLGSAYTLPVPKTPVSFDQWRNVCLPFVPLPDAATLPSPNVFTIVSRLARSYRSALALFWRPLELSVATGAATATTSEVSAVLEGLPSRVDLCGLMTASLLSGEPHLVIEALRMIEEWSQRMAVTPVTTVSDLATAANSGDGLSRNAFPVEEDSSGASSVSDITASLDSSDFFALPDALALCVVLLPVLYRHAQVSSASGAKHALSSSAIAFLASIRAKILAIIGYIPYAAWLSLSGSAHAVFLSLLIDGTHDEAAVVRSAAVKSMGSPALCLAIYDCYRDRDIDLVVLQSMGLPANEPSTVSSAAGRTGSQTLLGRFLACIVPLVGTVSERVVAVRMRVRRHARVCFLPCHICCFTIMFFFEYLCVSGNVHTGKLRQFAVDDFTTERTTQGSIV
jgi:hypothetical protein